MKIRLYSIWRLLPVPVITVDRMPGRLVGLCLGPAVIVREDYAADWPTIIHELTHCRQFWRGLAVLHLLRYYGSRRYRLDAELEAFRAEIAACAPEERPQRLHDSARSLATSYGLDLNVEACRLLLDATGPIRQAWQPGEPLAAGAATRFDERPALMPARADRRSQRGDRRCTPRRPGASNAPEHNRRRQVDRRNRGFNPGGLPA